MRNWGLGVVLALMVPSAASAIELVVIASDEAALKTGVIIDGGRPIAIAAGASVTLVSSTGRTIVLEGPYKGAPDSSEVAVEGELVQSLSRLIDQQQDSSTALAVFRGVDRKSHPARPDLWGIDIARGDRYCLRRDIAPFLWWEAARAGAIVSLSNAAQASRVVRIRWPSAKRESVWPDGLELMDGATYIARFRSGDAGESLVVRFMPDLPNDPHRIAWMAEHGCVSQASRILQALARGEL